MCYKIMFCKKINKSFDQRDALSASSGVFGLLHVKNVRGLTSPPLFFLFIFFWGASMSIVSAPQ